MASNLVEGRTFALLLVVVVVLALLLQVSTAAVYKVGDSAGWTTMGNVDYKQWAATKNFQLGDIILFQYNAQFHNVMRVNHADYRTCNTSSPMASYATGNDSITITSRGHHYFLCGVPGHCQAGQKVDINVPRATTSATPMAPTPSAMPAPTTPIAKVPGSSPSNAAPLISLASLFGNLVLAMAFLAVLVPHYA